MNRVLFGTLVALAAAACSSSESTTPEAQPAPAQPYSGMTPAAPEAPAAPPVAESPASPAAPSVPAAPATPAAPAGDPAPDFTLADPDGKQHSLADYRGKWVVLEWVNHGCPYVKKHYASNNMQQLQARYGAKGVAWLSICSSAPGKEGYEEPAAWKETLKKVGASPAAMLIDADGKVGRAYGAKVTPHMFVVSPEGAIVYRGAIDDKRSTKPADVASSRCYVSEVLDAVLAGGAPTVAETPAYG
jgi:alkyl hydroperoxide reductase subunit AhpC